MTPNNYNSDDKTKPRLSNQNTTPLDLKKHLILVFGSYKIASQRVGITEGRLHQIFMGVSIPSTPDLIKKYADAWIVDAVLLTQIFESLRNSYIPVKKFYEDFDKEIFSSSSNSKELGEEG